MKRRLKPSEEKSQRDYFVVATHPVFFKANVDDFSIPKSNLAHFDFNMFSDTGKRFNINSVGDVLYRSMGCVRGVKSNVVYFCCSICQVSMWTESTSSRSWRSVFGMRTMVPRLRWSLCIPFGCGDLSSRLCCFILLLLGWCCCSIFVV